jgi:hypothetical protein
VSPLELVDDRFDKLARELRAARPAASEAVRARVRALEPPAPPRRPEVRVRRLALAVALATVAISLSVALGIGLVQGTSKRATPGQALRASPNTTVPHEKLRSPRAGRPLRATATGERQAFSPGVGAVPSAPNRLQQYDAVLTLRVGDRSDLSARTSQAMRLTRALGGYVASATYNVPGKRGASVLVLRVPIDHVQQALEAFSAYGTIVSQRISVKDVQRRVDELGSTLAVLRKEVAAIERQLAGPLSAVERAQLEQRLASDRRRIKTLTSTRDAITRRAQLARVVLTLVMPRSHAAATPGRFERTMDDAGAVLVRELEILLYALVVVGPLLAIGGVAIAAGRAQRRRSDRRLLERT